MGLITEMHEMMVAAMKANDAKRRDALRLLLNALKVEEKNLMHALTADEEIAVLSGEAKKRREAIESYEAGGRADRAMAEQYELDVIVQFLPKALTEDEVRAMISAIIVEQGLKSKKDMGTVMKVLAPKLKGRFDGKQAKGLVDEMMSDLG